jgi:hypothetical protein
MKQPVELPVASMVVGDSFFVPCIDDVEIRRSLAQLAEDFKVKLRIERVVYKGMYGLRVWRILDTDI